MVQISVVVSLLITAATSFVSVSALAVSSRSIFAENLDPSIFPTQCQQGCTPIVNAVNTCTDLACFCTTANRDSLQFCANCVYSVDPDPAVVAAFQPGIDAFNGNCTSLPAVTLSTSAAGPTATA